MHLKIALASFLVLSSTIAGCQTQGSTPKTEVNTPAPDKVVNNEQGFTLPPPPLDLAPLSPSEHTESSAPMPCEESNLTLLSSKKGGETINEITEKTISAYPTFFFHLDKPTSKPIFFALTVAGEGKEKQIFEKRVAGDHSGLFAVELPPNHPPLEFAKKYRWSVQIVCTEKQFLVDNNYQWGIVERVPVAPKLQQKLASATSDYERARLYKQSGIWIDAVSSGYKAYEVNPKERPISEFFKKFLKESS